MLYFNKLTHIILINILIFSTLLKPLLAQQSNLILFDDFLSNQNNWTKIEGVAITDGHLNAKNTNHELQMYTMQIFIDYRENFRIESKMKQTAGKTDEGYGISWGSLGWENSFCFLVTSSGYFTIGSYADGGYYKICDWKKNNSIAPLGNYNILAIEKQGISLNFYINNKIVFTTQFTGFSGQMHGFLLKKSVTIAADYFKVTSEPRKIDVVSTELSKFKKENMGLKINSPYSEIAPIISPDGKTLYIGRIYHPRNFGKDKECDIWFSELNENGEWGELKNIGKPLNNSGVNVVITVTPDGNALLLEGLYKADGSHKSEQGISISYKTAQGWSIPKEVKIKNFYNKNIYETYCLSNDRKVLILAIERDDTYGDMDLYVSFLGSDGSYSEPKNMGAVLNTFAGDGTPYLAADNTTLYISSYGRTGFGSSDIYVTKRLDDTWLNWSTPKNLGNSINSQDWDTYLSIAAKGDYAYLVSTSNSYGNEDIFALKLTEEIKPDPVVMIYGKVLNAKTKKPLGADIYYENLKSGKEVGIAQSDPKTGDYTIVLPYGINYGFHAEAGNFLSENENIDLKGIKEYREIKRDLYLTPLEIGESIILKNVFFVQAKSELLETSFPELDRLVNLMKNNKNLEIELRGHTENKGNAAELLALSEQRVAAVKNYITSKGIEPKRITGKGMGGTQPVNYGQTEADRTLNRRVEFVVIKK